MYVKIENNSTQLGQGFDVSVVPENFTDLTTSLGAVDSVFGLDHPLSMPQRTQDGTTLLTLRDLLQEPDDDKRFDALHFCYTGDAATDILLALATVAREDPGWIGYSARDILTTATTEGLAAPYLGVLMLQGADLRLTPAA